ncbi:class I SAM-dependent methyltransferase [Actinoplanes sp. TBRC 11911]|uniref:class I SAM-dependent methyltransferase n=1 Tax=Actinoplanes sp. TBRC 11911 TaxID=2729386 RepID=UPI00145C4012|nr:class I SAM-dependent methyltransferase [Actinoplanes sp. TBRC 11911]NMO52574.1 class I SAM-dependent methyltransferase [Actinoplanes sp. TBRC 11911]
MVKLFRRLSTRQLGGLLVVAAVCAAVAVASVAGQAAVATCLLALLLAGVLAGVVHLSRRIRGVHRSTQASVRELRGVVEQLQRRVIASVEKERLAAGDRHQELTESLGRTERLTGRGAELLLREQSREIEALVQLFQLITPRAPMPPAGTLNPTDLLGLVHFARNAGPGLAVALGSGPSTVWLGYALPGRLVAVDHDLDRVTATRQLLHEHGLSDVAVRHAPKAPLPLEGASVDWYETDALDDLRDIALLVVDGTLALPGADALTPALHVLAARLAPGATVVVDEAPARVAPRQGGGMTAQRPLTGRWTALSQPGAPIPTR